MEQLEFTSRILGPEAAEKLKRGEVTQTLRGRLCDVVQSVLQGDLLPGESLEIVCDGNVLGNAEYQGMDEVWRSELTPEDATRGGFASLGELRKALLRAGFRFQPAYSLCRIRFIFLEEA